MHLPSLVPPELRETADNLAEVHALRSTLHLPGVRDLRRGMLETIIEEAERFLHARDLASDPESVQGARWLLLCALVVRAEDARYGAGQLARGAQRAPTVEDCEDGWERVTSIVETSEVSSRIAHRLAHDLGHPRARRLANEAEEAARRARTLLVDRNHAYTFHADPHFSFGEGWYVAAAGVLSNISIQIQPHQPQSEQAEYFLGSAGVSSQIVPYRSRPRANKALPDLIARVFRAHPRAAQERLRAAFLDGEIPGTIRRWTSHALATAPPGKKVLLWLRYGTHHPMRNTVYPELVELCRRAREVGASPIFVGDALQGGDVPPGVTNLALFWREPLFQGLDMRRAQLQFFECLRADHELVGQLGVTTAGMDGPALMGLPTLYLTREPNLRLGRWVGAVPGYQEMVRDERYLERVSATLRIWTER